jgi:type I restriction enzyme S subunit
MGNTVIQETIDRSQFVSEGYKKTSLGSIPNEWEIKKLGEFLDYIQPTNYLNDDIVDLEDEVNNIPVLTAGKSFVLGYTVNDDKTFSNIPIILFDDFTTENKYVDFPFKIRSSAAKILIAKNNLFNFKFIYEAMQIINFVSTDHKRYWISEYQNLKLPIPPLPEQQKIAEILSTWDEAITKCKATIYALRDRNKGLSQQLLTGKKRLSGFGDNWATKKIKDFSLEISSKNKEDEDLIVLSCTKHNGLVPSLEYFGRKIYSDNLKTYKIVAKNVFAYATNHIEEGSIGYQSKYEKALISPMYTVFKTDDDINDEFLFRVLKSNTYIQEYQKRMEGSIDRRGGLRWQEFSKIKVSVPSYEEQTAITLALETADQELKSYKTKLEALQLQKKGLMQQLLTGKIRVNL